MSEAAPQEQREEDEGAKVEERHHDGRPRIAAGKEHRDELPHDGHHPDARGLRDQGPRRLVRRVRVELTALEDHRHERLGQRRQERRRRDADEEREPDPERVGGLQTFAISPCREQGEARERGGLDGHHEDALRKVAEPEGEREVRLRAET